MAFKNWLAGGLLVALLSTNAFAWGSKEHMLLTRLAMLRLLDDPRTPADMRAWLQTLQPDLGDLAAQEKFFKASKIGPAAGNATGISWWVVQPDVRSGDKTTPVPPFGVNEQKLHFVDMELLNADIARRTYKHDLSNAIDIKLVPRDLSDERWKEAGVLPFAVEHSYKELVAQLKAGRLTATDKKDENNAQKWAAFLAHYLEDNTQPLHASEDYLGRSYFANRRGAPNVHSEMEYRMNDDEKTPFTELRAEYWKLLVRQIQTFKEPVKTDESDLWLSTLQVSAESYKNIPLIGLAAMKASGQQGTPDKPTGRSGPLDTERFFRHIGGIARQESVMQMKARQQAWAVVRVASVWRRAWDEARAK